MKRNTINYAFRHLLFHLHSIVAIHALFITLTVTGTLTFNKPQQPNPSTFLLMTTVGVFALLGIYSFIYRASIERPKRTYGFLPITWLATCVLTTLGLTFFGDFSPSFDVINRVLQLAYTNEVLAHLICAGVAYVFLVVISLFYRFIGDGKQVPSPLSEIGTHAYALFGAIFVNMLCLGIGRYNLIENISNIQNTTEQLLSLDPFVVIGIFWLSVSVMLTWFIYFRKIPGYFKPCSKLIVLFTINFMALQFCLVYFLLEVDLSTYINHDVFFAPRVGCLVFFLLGHLHAYITTRPQKRTTPMSHEEILQQMIHFAADPEVDEKGFQDWFFNTKVIAEVLGEDFCKNVHDRFLHDLVEDTSSMAETQAYIQDFIIKKYNYSCRCVRLNDVETLDYSADENPYDILKDYEVKKYKTPSTVYSKCRSCQQDWFVSIDDWDASEAYLYKLLPEEVADIEKNRWPNYFDEIEMWNKDNAKEHLECTLDEWLFRTNDPTLYLSSLPKDTQEITLWGPFVNDDILTVLPKFTELKVLRIFNSQISDSDKYWQTFGQFSKLETLEVAGANISDYFLGSNLPFKNLVELNLSATNISDDILHNLKEMPNITKIKLSRTDITNTTAFYLLQRQGLNYIDLAGTDIDDKAIASMKENLSLEELHLEETKITEASIPKLLAQKHLKVLRIHNTEISQEKYMEILEQLPKLPGWDEIPDFSKIPSYYLP